MMPWLINLKHNLSRSMGRLAKESLIWNKPFTKILNDEMLHSINGLKMEK